MENKADEAIIRDIFGAQKEIVSNPFGTALEYVEAHMVALSDAQAQALAYLEALGGRHKRYQGIIDAVLRYRSLTGDPEIIIRAIEALAFYSKFAGITASVSRERKV